MHIVKQWTYKPATERDRFMKVDKFTLKAQEALATAQQIAMAKSHMVLSPLHLLSAICDDEDGVVVMTLKKIGANLPQIKSMIDSEMGIDFFIRSTPDSSRLPVYAAQLVF